MAILWLRVIQKTRTNQKATGNLNWEISTNHETWRTQGRMSRDCDEGQGETVYTQGEDSGNGDSYTAGTNET